MKSQAQQWEIPKREIVEIIEPGPEGTGGPQPHPLDEYCNISADGDVDENRVEEIRSVRGRIGGGQWTGGTFSFPYWELAGVGPALSGEHNTLEVEVTLIRTGFGYEEVFDRSRVFLGTGGGPSCYSGSLPVRWPGQQAPITQVLPRYYRLIVGVQAINPPDPDQDLFPLGLGESDSVYLAYDPTLSTPYEAVWREINLPEAAGRYTLRVKRVSCRLSGELVVQHMSQREVFPAAVFACPDWSAQGDNILGTAFATDHAQGQKALSIVAEPA